MVRRTRLRMIKVRQILVIASDLIEETQTIVKISMMDRRTHHPRRTLAIRRSLVEAPAEATTITITMTVDRAETIEKMALATTTEDMEEGTTIIAKIRTIGSSNSSMSGSTQIRSIQTPITDNSTKTIQISSMRRFKRKSHLSGSRSTSSRPINIKMCNIKKMNSRT